MVSIMIVITLDGRFNFVFIVDRCLDYNTLTHTRIAQWKHTTIRLQLIQACNQNWNSIGGNLSKAIFEWNIKCTRDVVNIFSTWTLTESYTHSLTHSLTRSLSIYCFFFFFYYSFPCLTVYSWCDYCRSSSCGNEQKERPKFKSM